MPFVSGCAGVASVVSVAGCAGLAGVPRNASFIDCTVAPLNPSISVGNSTPAGSNSVLARYVLRSCASDPIRLSANL